MCIISSSFHHLQEHCSQLTCHVFSWRQKQALSCMKSDICQRHAEFQLTCNWQHVPQDWCWHLHRSCLWPCHAQLCLTVPPLWAASSQGSLSLDPVEARKKRWVYCETNNMDMDTTGTPQLMTLFFTGWPAKQKRKPFVIIKRYSMNMEVCCQ